MVVIAGTPWARAAVTPELRAEVAAMLPRAATRVVVGAGRSPSDWTAEIYGPTRGADPLGVARHAVSVRSAIAAAVADVALGQPLAWCSDCPEPAEVQRAGEARCLACSRSRARGGSR